MGASRSAGCLRRTPLAARGIPCCSSRPYECYFLAAGFVLSCLGLRFFLSFFCELLPLPMLGSPVAAVSGRRPVCRTDISIGKKPESVEFDTATFCRYVADSVRNIHIRFPAPDILPAVAEGYAVE